MIPAYYKISSTKTRNVCFLFRLASLVLSITIYLIKNLEKQITVNLENFHYSDEWRVKSLLLNKNVEHFFKICWTILREAFQNIVGIFLFGFAVFISKYFLKNFSLGSKKNFRNFNRNLEDWGIIGIDYITIDYYDLLKWNPRTVETFLKEL